MIVHRMIPLGFLLALAGCTSPEATRTQGGGPGADTGNRGEVVRMHEGSRPFYKTPHVAPGEPGPVASAQHARERSL
ncbi:MAG: hypothetical protein ACT4PS_02485 [Betaproteobacteria bacterium]